MDFVQRFFITLLNAFVLHQDNIKKQNFGFWTYLSERNERFTVLYSVMYMFLYSLYPIRICKLSAASLSFLIYPALLAKIYL